MIKVLVYIILWHVLLSSFLSLSLALVGDTNLWRLIIVKVVYRLSRTSAANMQYVVNREVFVDITIVTQTAWWMLIRTVEVMLEIHKRLSLESIHTFHILFNTQRFISRDAGSTIAMIH